MIPHNAALSVDETDQMSDLLAAKYIARADELTPTLIEATSVVLAARLSRYLYEQRNRPDENETLRDACVLCEGMCLEDRVRVDKGNHVVVPCFLCRPRAFTAYHAMIARHEESQALDRGDSHGPSCSQKGLSPSGLRPLSSDCDVATESQASAYNGDAGSPLAREPALSDDAPATLRTGMTLLPHVKRGLETLREGSLACQQPMTTVRVLTVLHTAALIETRGAAYYLTDKGREAIR